MICKNCGKENSAGAKFCLNCGSNLEEQNPVIFCSECFSVVDENEKYCEKCGSPIVSNYTEGKMEEDKAKTNKEKTNLKKFIVACVIILGICFLFFTWQIAEDKKKAEAAIAEMPMVSISKIVNKSDANNGNESIEIWYSYTNNHLEPCSPQKDLIMYSDYVENGANTFNSVPEISRYNSEAETEPGQTSEFMVEYLNSGQDEYKNIVKYSNPDAKVADSETTLLVTDYTYDGGFYTYD